MNQSKLNPATWSCMRSAPTEISRVCAGNVLYLKTERESSSYFNLIKAVSEGQNTFVLAGDGTLRMYKVHQV